jgi:hypothetical protein
MDVLIIDRVAFAIGNEQIAAIVHQSFSRPQEPLFPVKVVSPPRMARLNQILTIGA